MTLRRYLVLFAVAIFAACGDVCLARGMKDFGAVTSTNWNRLLASLWNPWVLAGICLLVLFLSSYLTALSWADLTYVLPATAMSYVLMALLGRFFLHENVTVWRWLGVALITAGVGFVAGGPALTPVGQAHSEIENSPSHGGPGPELHVATGSRRDA
ncbi:MAG: EamA family transporter [Candidatus Korobacteraceae bacterium]